MKILCFVDGNAQKYKEKNERFRNIISQGFLNRNTIEIFGINAKKNLALKNTMPKLIHGRKTVKSAVKLYQ